MSVDIISIGNPKYFYVRCDSCGSLLRYTLGDERGNISPFTPYGMSTEYSITCAHCGYSVITRGIAEEAEFDNRIPEAEVLQMRGEE